MRFKPEWEQSNEVAQLSHRVVDDGQCGNCRTV